jgi:hypothetical protein
LQKKKNKVAKSAWKFLQARQEDFYLYNKEFKLLYENQGKQYAGFRYNNFIINNLNYMHWYTFHLGNCFTDRHFSPYSVSSKASEFLKYTKPFHFRSKKKKK